MGSIRSVSTYHSGGNESGRVFDGWNAKGSGL